ncbi:hypothetical protein CLOP_g3721 [Closterium sp. NIES-67]|nr:hypothetical protein CLOP_g3721 [Closterium sp. NIES-67]
MWEAVLPLRLLRGMELQGAAEEEGVGEAEAVGGALAEVEAEVTIMRGMEAPVAGGVPEWRAPAGTARSFNSVKADGTSIVGYVCLLGGGAVSWRSKKQNEVGLSSYVGMVDDGWQPEGEIVV